MPLKNANTISPGFADIGMKHHPIRQKVKVLERGNYLVLRLLSSCKLILATKSFVYGVLLDHFRRALSGKYLT